MGEREPAAGEPWLSVLVPAHNVAPYLEAMLESVLSQADAGVEIRLFDDASTDGSAEIAARVAARHGRDLQLQRSAANVGVAAARNALLDAARGRWLWFVDADDLVEPGVLPLLRERLLAGAAPELLLLDYRVLRARERWRHRLRGERHRRGFVGDAAAAATGGPALLEGVLASGNVFCWTVVARRELWRDGPRFPAGHVFEDMATMPRLLLHARSAAHLPRPCIAYRRRDDSVSGVMSAAKVADLARSLVGLRDDLLRHWPEAAERTRFVVAHQAARNLVAAVRHARRLPAEQAAELLPRCRADFLLAVGDDLPLLWQGYRLRLWGARAWALQRALGAAR